MFRRTVLTSLSFLTLYLIVVSAVTAQGGAVMWYDTVSPSGTFNVADSLSGTDLIVDTKLDDNTTLPVGYVWDGKTLTKKGAGTMALTADNGYTGGSILKEGTLEFSQMSNLGTGPIKFDGGVLRNTAVVTDFNRSVSATSGNSVNFDTASDLTVTRPLAGSFGLSKTGGAKLTLRGHHTYSGNTDVQAGTLAVDGDIQSKVFVQNGAVLTGTGIIYNDVKFESGSVYQWTCNPRAADSAPLWISGHVTLDNTVFRPFTANGETGYPTVIDHWTVLKYDGELKGTFASIDSSLSPFYDFELDYSTPYAVKVIGYNRNTPRPMSDSVATGLNMAQRKIFRKPFDQIDRELQRGRNLGLKPVKIGSNGRIVRGQAQDCYSSRLWGEMYGRGTRFASTYYANDWKLNSFGVQAGYSFHSSNWFTWGLTAGAEVPMLKNNHDKIEATDGFLGIYYGQRIYGMWELKGFAGAGSQYYKSTRWDSLYSYSAKYHGDSFEANIELGRPLLFGQFQIRPFIGFDVEYASQQTSVESKSSSEYRTYSGTSLTQTYVRVGIDAQKRYDNVDTFLGVSYSNMIGGDHVPHVYVYYPTVKKGVDCYGADLGQNIFTIRAGGNWFLDPSECRSIFLTFNWDIYADRAEGQNQITVSGGFSKRF